jgi:hypothetical protein
MAMVVPAREVETWQSRRPPAMAMLRTRVVEQLVAPLPESGRLVGLMTRPWNAVVIARALRIRLWPIEPRRQQARAVEMLPAFQH